MARKLTLANVMEIELRLSWGESQASIARDFKVSPQCINDIACGRTWREKIRAEVKKKKEPEG